MPAILMIFSPTSRLPVKLIFRTRGSVQSLSPSRTAAAGEAIDCLRRQTGFQQDFDELQTRERSVAGGLEHHGVAGGQRRADFVAGQIERKVERRDGHHHAAGHAQREAEFSLPVGGAVQRQHFAADAFGLFGRKFDRFDGPRGFGGGFLMVLPSSEAEGARQIVATLVHQFGGVAARFETARSRAWRA